MVTRHHARAMAQPRCNTAKVRSGYDLTAPQSPHAALPCAAHAHRPQNRRFTAVRVLDDDARDLKLGSSPAECISGPKLKST